MAFVTLATTLATAACSATSAPASSPTPSPSPQSTASPLVINPAVAVTYTQNFNPFDPQSTASTLEIRSLVYEPLYEIDALTPALSGMHPWLATGYAFEDGGTELRIAVRGGVRLSDGTAFGPADVAATFRAIRDDPAADYSGVPAQSAAPTISGSTVTLHFATPEYTVLEAVLGGTFMVPASLISRLGSDLATGVVTDPVGTGPFTLQGVASQELLFRANPRYWGGPPSERELEISGDATPLAVEERTYSGEVDWSGGVNTLPDLVVADPVFLGTPMAPPFGNGSTSWFAAGDTVTLDFNLAPGNGGAAGTADPAVRQAVSLGIDRNALSVLGESGWETPASSQGGLTPGQLGAYPNATHTDALPVQAARTLTSIPGWTGPTVESVLEADGWTPPAAWGTGSEANCDGTAVADCWSKDGEIIKFSIWDPVSIPDVWEDAALISALLQTEGMDVTDNPARDPSGGGVQWQHGLEAGDFQTALLPGAGGSIPFIQLDGWLDYSDHCTTTGGAVSCASGDYGRFFSTAAETALQEYQAADPATAAGKATIAAAISTLEGIMATDVPDAPVLYGADWADFSQQDYTGWPGPSDPYAEPAPLDPELPYILMRLRPV